VYSTGDIIDTWVYREGLLNLQYGLATAVGLLKSAVGFILITISYYLANRFTSYRIF
ncbi:sugar ABC transporter permease, partial [Paenibacillus elgii]|nr:sugar ABC transporter permease [Paenibacillus elgii]